MDFYEIDSYLGSGGYGKVVKAHVKNLPYDKTKPLKAGDTVAIKLVDKIFPVELDVLSRFDHQNVVKAFDFGYDFKLNNKTSMYFVMPKAQHDLYNAVSKNYLTFDDKVKIIDDLFCGLSFLHSQNLIHLDIKPVNILLFNEDNKWVAKYTDFGMSQYINDNLKTCTRNRYTTITYRPPEFFNRGENKLVDIFFYSDIWSLGLTILFILYGRTLYTGIISYEDIFNWMNDFSSSSKKESFIRNRLNNVPPDKQQYYFDIINDMIELDPTKRLSDINSIINKYQLGCGKGTTYKLFQPVNPSTTMLNGRTITLLNSIKKIALNIPHYRTETFFYGIDLFYRVRNLQLNENYYNNEYMFLFFCIYIIAVMFNDDVSNTFACKDSSTTINYVKVIYDITNGILKGDNYFLLAPRSEKLSLMNKIENPEEYNNLKNLGWEKSDDIYEEGIYFNDYLNLYNSQFS